MHKIVIFASGNGTNAENIIRYFQNSQKGRVTLVVASKEGLPVIERAEKLGVKHALLTREDMKDKAKVISIMEESGADFCVLAGYLLLVPKYLISYFHGRVVNIHPALLPRHGGKGMYGDRVHEDVLRCGDKVSGITIHYIDEHFDQGQNILQAYCPVLENDTPHTLAQRIHALEYAYFPVAIEQVLPQAAPGGIIACHWAP